MENPAIQIKIAEHPQDFSEAKKLILDYVTWLGIDLSFQNFDQEINNLENMYNKLDGGLLLASINNQAAGVAGIRKFDNKECELKRMFVKSGFRNLGIGKLLLAGSIELAKRLNYEIIKLDTADFMKAAIKLYKDYGFIEIAQYRYNPHESARYFELNLRTR